jgi:hypothetical protein
MTMSDSATQNESVSGTNEKSFGSEARPAPIAHLPSLEHPWLGLESFHEETRAFFFGREAEIAELLLRLRSQPLLVLYGRSGLGKTSVLTAGLIPRLRAEGWRPQLLRLRYDQGAAEPCVQIASTVFGCAEGQIGQVVHPNLYAAEIERWTQQLGRELGIILPDDYPSRLWLRLHYLREPPGITNLVLDQFEEAFTLGGQVSGAESSIRGALTILIQGAIPEPITRLIAEHDAFLDDFDPDSVPVRVIIALRDDYVYGLNRWQRHLPALGQNNFELRALRGRAAFEAVFKPGELRCHYRGEVGDENRLETGLPPIIDRDTAKQIVQFIAKKSADIPIEEIDAEPPILSLLCHELNERRFAASVAGPAAQISFRESDTDIQSTIADFYERCLAGRPEAVRVFIEEEMVSYSGARLAQDEQSILCVFEQGCIVPGAADDRRAAGFGDPHAARVCLRELVHQHLLRPSGGDRPVYELINDLLALVVEQSRIARMERLEKEEADRRLEEESIAKSRAEDRARRTQRQMLMTVVALMVAVIAAVIGFHQYGIAEKAKQHAKIQKQIADEATKRATEISEELKRANTAVIEARDKAVSAKKTANELINFLQYDLRNTVEKIGRLDMMSALDDRIRKYHLEHPAEAGDLDTSPSKASH